MLIPNDCARADHRQSAKQDKWCYPEWGTKMKKSRVKRVCSVLLAAVMAVILAQSLIGVPAAYALVPSQNLLINGSFEQDPNGVLPPGTGANPGPGWSNGTAESSDIPGWWVTPVLHGASPATYYMEIWHSGFNPGQNSTPAITFWTTPQSTNSDPTAAANHYMAEINSDGEGRMYQDVATVPGALYNWSIEHRGRMSRTVPDVANIEIGDPSLFPDANTDDLTPPATPALVQQLIDSSAPDVTVASTTNAQSVILGWNANNNANAATGWGLHSGYYTATSATTRFALTAETSANGNNTMGNLVDNAYFALIATPTTQTQWAGSPMPGDPSLISWNTANTDTAVMDAAAESALTSTQLNTPGTYQVPVDVMDENGDVVGTIISTVIVKAITQAPPQATDNSYTTAPGTAVNGNIITTDTGAGSDSGTNITITDHTSPVDSVSGMPIGSLMVSDDGQFTFTPPAGYTGTVQFTYTITQPASDFGPAMTSTATVTITVKAAGIDTHTDPVVPPTTPRTGDVWGLLGLSAAALLLLGGGGALVYRRRKQQKGPQD